MPDGFPFIHSPANPLASMLAQMGAQGNAARLNAYSPLAAALASIGQDVGRGFTRKGAYVQQTAEREAGQAFRAGESEKDRALTREGMEQAKTAADREFAMKELGLLNRDIDSARAVLADQMSTPEARAEAQQSIMRNLKRSNELRAYLNIVPAAPVAMPTSRTPTEMSESLGAGAAGRIAPPSATVHIDTSGITQPGGFAGVPGVAPKASQPKAVERGAASAAQQKRTWARIVASDPGVRSRVRGMAGVDVKRPEARLYAKVADVLLSNKNAGFPLTLEEIKAEARDELKAGGEAFAGVASERFSPTNYVYYQNPKGPGMLVRDRSTGKTFTIDQVRKHLGATALAPHPMHGGARFGILQGVKSGAPVYARYEGQGVVQSHPAFSDEVFNAVIDEIARQIGYGAD